MSASCARAAFLSVRKLRLKIVRIWRTNAVMNYAQKIIQRFGGVRALARLMQRPTSTVGSWGDRGSIPDEDKARIMCLSVQQNINLTAQDFFPVELLPPQEDAA